MAETADIRAQAQDLFRVAVRAADPDRAVRRFATDHGLSTAPDGNTLIVAFGKAAPAMARAALAHVPAGTECLVITHHENAQEVEGATVMTAGHPVPDAAGAKAASELIGRIKALGEADQVIALVSGGASALLPAPPEGISLADKQALNAALLASGLDIVSMNLVRQQVSDLKGGGLARLASPASVRALILSDVIGDDLRAIASGPTVSPLGTAEDAIGILQTAGVWDRVPQSIKDHLTRSTGAVETPQADNHLIGSNRVSLDAMRQASAGAQIVSDRLEGDVDAAAELVATHARAAQAGVHLFGGETTVVLKGDGKGGRNQELAARVAQKLAGLKRPWVFLSGGTDGRDGPTDAAGGVVDGGTWARAGGRAEALLANNDSYALLKAAGDLLITEATGTNVADVQVLILE
ncbi:MAG: DUF4147 domain-containing protein [Pseudomonadota bacterium]